MLPLKDNNPRRSFPIVNFTIIAINIGVFLYELSLGRHVRQFFLSYGFIPFELTHFRTIYGTVPFYLKILTSMFVHGGWMHIIGNMLYLWIFGDNVEDVFGHASYMFFYLISGLFAVISQTLIHANSHIPNIGASGAISGVLGAYFVFFPKAKVLTLVPDLLFLGFFYRLMYIPAYIIIGIWFVLQLLSGLASLSVSGGIAFFAHVGGFLTGFIVAHIYILSKRNRWKRSTGL